MSSEHRRRQDRQLRRRYLIPHLLSAEPISVYHQLPCIDRVRQQRPAAKIAETQEAVVAGRNWAVKGREMT
jgi:hypothetical protein